MTTYRQIPQLSLEDASVGNYYHASDDELDEATRAAKRRRIETLGESYLRGKPLFIASASLRGPFEKGWVNPWKKQRKAHEAESSKINTKKAARPVNARIEDMVPGQENSEPKGKSASLRRDNAIYAGIQDLRRKTASPRSTPYSERRHSKSLQIPESSPSQVIGKFSTDVQVAQSWLKRDKKSIDIQNYEPPRSPSSRYANSRANGAIKEPKHPHRKVEPSLGRVSKVHQTDLRNVRRDKPISGESQEKIQSTKLRCISQALFDKEEPKPMTGGEGPSEAILMSDTAKQSERQLGKEPQSIDAASEAVEFPEKAIPASESSVHIIPPSSHLPEFEYRLARSQSVKQSEVRPNHGSEVEGASVMKTALRSEFVPPRDPQEHASVRMQTSASTLGTLQNQEESLTESEKITSAQVVPKQPGISTCMVSLHSTEMRGFGAADSGTASIDAELSTQAAFELAHKSFQDDLATPHRDYQDTSKMSKGLNSSIKRITPFANINTSSSMFDIKVGSKFTPGAAPNMNTQAMIDAFTPFSDMIGETSGKRTEQRPNPQPLISQIKHSVVFGTPLVPLPRSKSVDESPSKKEAQSSGHTPLPSLPLTLSGTTPATNQQDGQGFQVSMDAFDVSQVIQDAGSWLQQSWDVKTELERHTGRSTQSSPPSSRPEATFI